MIEFIDTHSHLYSEQFNDDIDEVVSRAKDSGVAKIVLPAINSQTHSQMFDLAAKYDNLYPTIGLHPTDVKSDYGNELDIVSRLLHEHKKEIVAIGEIGLDLYWDKTYFKEQEIAFKYQLNLAIENNLPAIIHTRDAYEEMIGMIEEYKNSGLKAVFHSFSGSTEQAERLLSLGDYYLGIGGVVTFKKSTLIDVVKSVGIERIVLETDSPYLAPTPHRGKRNESSNIPIIATFISKEMNVSMEYIANITNNNCKKLFF